MAGDVRFGIELYDEPLDGDRIGHVWSPDAELVVRGGDGTVSVVDPSGANPRFLNTSRDALEGFLEAFLVFAQGSRPAGPGPLTVTEARARLAALHRGETLPPAPAPVPVPRADRLATLLGTLGAQDRAALASGTWWARILARPEFAPDGEL